MKLLVFILAALIAVTTGQTTDVPSTTTAAPVKYRERYVRPNMTVDLPVPGIITCSAASIEASSQTPTNANQVRPADIKYIAALGDSISTGVFAYNLDSEVANPDDFDNMNFVGNSFVMGGDGDLETHLTLPNILRRLNPSLVGFSVGTGVTANKTVLNAAVSGKTSDDFHRQANDLVARFTQYPATSVQNEWKLINFFIGTNEILAFCRTNTGTSKAVYKKNIRDAIVTIQNNLPRSIISLIGLWNLNFDWLAAEIVFNSTYPCAGTNFKVDAQLRTFEYREALVELAADPTLQTANHAVVVQRVFDDLYEPLMKADGTYNYNFYATDMMHLSKYGHSLVAKQLWKQLLQPVGGKSTTNNEMTNGNPMISCPDENCPYIRTIANSINCVLPDSPKKGGKKCKRGSHCHRSRIGA